MAIGGAVPCRGLPLSKADDEVLSPLAASFIHGGSSGTTGVTTRPRLPARMEFIGRLRRKESGPLRRVSSWDLSWGCVSRVYNVA